MKKAIVGGTRFGQFYLEALRLLPDVEVVGILAKGSEKSIKCAEYYGIELYTDMEALPGDIDFACVAIKSGVMGGEGDLVAQKLMQRGIPVIFEQPLQIKEAADCFLISEKSEVKFMIGNLYMNLPAVKNFIENVKRLSRTTQPLYINIDFATQVSYPLIQILDCILPSARSSGLRGKILEVQPFQSAVVVTDGIEINYRAHNEIDQRDLDGYLHLFFQICVGYPGGRITLSDPHGPVLWQPRVHFPEEDLIPVMLSECDSLSMKEPNTYVIYSNNTTLEEIFTKQWPQAIGEDIEKLIGMISAEDLKGVKPRIQKQLFLCRQWQQLTQSFGYPYIVEKSEYGYIPNEIFEVHSSRQPREGGVKVGIDSLNHACYLTMLYYMQKNIPEIRQAEAYSTEEIIAGMDIDCGFGHMIERWFRILSAENFILLEDNTCYFEIDKVTEQEMMLAWDRAKLLWTQELGTTAVFHYFRENAFKLEAIMKGDLNPAWLLFPEGKFDLATELYSQTAIAKALNRIVADDIAAIAGRKALNLLEVGGGTGATTVGICRELSKCGGCKEYLFTDVSDFFLRNARKKLIEYPWMKFKKLDIDSTQEIGRLAGQEYDVIVAVGVINNAENVLKTMSSLNQLLLQNGVMFLIEAIGESAPMLISQAFMMKETIDNRSNENLTFLTLLQWYDIFEHAGFSLEKKVPDKSSELAMYNQRLFVLRKS